jgi:CheY-like chemotaxis protein
MSKKVLIVEDEPDILKMTEFRVRNAGYETVTATYGQEALDKVQSEKPDLILMDYKLPGMTGVEIYNKLQEDESCQKIDVIFLTASKGNIELVEKMEEIGVEHCLIKPYEPEELLNMIKELLGE